MKNLVLVAVLLFSLTSKAQVNVETVVDEMTDKVSYYASERFICADESMTKGCAIDPSFSESKGVKEVKHLIVTMVGLGNCNENNELIILFDNGEKITLKSWNKFNCKGNAYFSITNTTTEKLKTNPISKVRITNGDSYKSYTSEITYKNYFIDLYNNLND